MSVMCYAAEAYKQLFFKKLIFYHRGKKKPTYFLCRKILNNCHKVIKNMQPKNGEKMIINGVHKFRNTGKYT